MGERTKTVISTIVDSGKQFEQGIRSISRVIANRVYAGAYSSEMFCSLKYEDYRGCPYNMFSHSQIAWMSAAVFAISTCSIILGA